MDQARSIDGVDFHALGYFLFVLDWVAQPDFKFILDIGRQWVEELNDDGLIGNDPRIMVLQC